ncbi:FtsX-like permease family protein [Actinomadura verrucosospora]|uniref:ABC transporter permease n=1 Tax=Actinomadura verrucosospora TaxID=46165 RepID=A0A7D3VS59_ACTVE|nr:FtsX-like permease family protein [Actinomadura verrucosospora]QKG21520.1 ABC transporter permease [Actinomadura verrucosospora]
MRTTLDLTWRLLRGGGRRNLLGSLLTLAAVAVCTGLLLFAVTANLAFAQRAHADSWRHPGKADAHPVMIEALATDRVRDEPITVVDLAALGPDAPAPPGMPRFPRPGEAWTSPALARLMKDLPADRLAGRFPARAGTLGRDALIHPGELVAVVGHAPGDPAMTAARNDLSGVENTAAPTRIAAYATGAATFSGVYQALVAIASVLMVVPLLVFGGAAARLTVARRDRRLAALRLVGATPGQVVAITTAEAVITAAAGAVAGTVLYAAAIPALMHITIAGGGWYASDLWPGLPIVAGVLAAVPVLVGASAVVGLRRIVVSPLGVARRETPPAMRAVRPLVLVAVVIAFGAVSGGLTGLGRLGLVIMLVFLMLAFLAINLAGPWVVALIGRITVGLARGPARLLAGRRLMDDPRSAWRTVAGVALTGFVAGFLALLGGASTGTKASDELQLTVPPARASAVAEQIRGRLGGIDAGVTVKPLSTGDPAAGAAGPPAGAAGGDRPAEAAVVTVAVRGGSAAVDRARTVLAAAVPGQVATTPADEDRGRDRLLSDLRTGALTVLVVSFLIAITSAGITGASAVLDRRQAYAMLRLAGTPLKVLDRARRQETLIPLVVMGGGSLATGLFFAAPFAIGFGASGAVTLAAFVAVGFGGIAGASALSRPLLRSVTTDPAPTPD